MFLRWQKKGISILAFMLSFVFSFMSITMLKIFLNTFFFICMTSRLWQKRLVFQQGNSQKILGVTQLWFTAKLGNFCLSDWKLNTMPLYCETTSYNSSPDDIGDATLLSTLPTKKSLMFFLYLWLIGNQKIKFYHHLLRWRPCYFLYSMDNLLFHACSNHKNISYAGKSLTIYIKAIFI